MMYFLNPWAMVVGGAMVSAPILIHLINRMRFKRVRWAAMEFLLKSQKRNRRRLIIEQLILLALRCLLVLLFGILTARFVGDALGRTPASSTTHVVLLDTTPSMSDRKDQAKVADAFEQAKESIMDLANTAFQSPSAQNFIVVTTSNLNEPIFKGALNDVSLRTLRKALEDEKVTMMHVPPGDAVEGVRKHLEAAKESKRWLHVVSDFRDRDWSNRTANDKLHTTLNDIAESGTQVSLIDCVTPDRRDAEGKALEHNNNFVITDLRPLKRVVPAGIPVPFTFELANLGTEKIDTLRVVVYTDGKEDNDVSLNFQNIGRSIQIPEPGKRVRHYFEKNFNDQAGGATSIFHRITLSLEKKVDAVTGLLADNIRHTIVEVRKPKDESDPDRRGVPTLVIDGAGYDQVTRSGADSRVIKDALKTLKGIEAVEVVTPEKGIEELLRPDLDRQYATIYLLNIEKLGEEKKPEKGKEKEADPKEKEKKDKKPKKATILEKLRQYVANGGNVVWFTGDKVDTTYYNDILFEQSQGLFPVPIIGKSPNMDAKQLEARRKFRGPKVFVLDKEHGITSTISLFPPIYWSDLLILNYTVAKPRFEWKQPWSHESDVKDLIAMANMTRNDNRAREHLTRDVLSQIKTNEAWLADKPKVKERLKTFLDRIVEKARTAAEHELYQVVEQIDKMMADRGEKPGEKDNVSLEEYWSHPETNEIKANLLEFRKEALLGEPLAVTRKYGKGSVVAFLTTPGQSWTGWSGGENSGPLAQTTFPILITELQKFLTRGGDGGHRAVGESIQFELDPAQYKDKVQRHIQVNDELGVEMPANGQPGFKVEEPTTGKLENGQLAFNFPAARTAGVHVFRISPQLGEQFEERWFVFNIDTEAESDLRRVSSEQVERNPTDASADRGLIKFLHIKDIQTALRDSRKDLSETPWIYIVFLIVLIAEQALAVHLSFHVKGTDASAGKGAAAQPATVAAPAAQREAAQPAGAGV